MRPIDILITSVLEAFRRVRTLLFVLVMACALLIANQYLDHYSFDRAQLLNSNLALEKLEELSENEKDPVKKSAYQVRIVRVKNSLADLKFRSLTIPLIGLTIPTNDLNVIVGIFLIPLGVWIIFSLNQIILAVDQEDIEGELRQFLPYMRHAGLFLYIDKAKLTIMVMSVVVFALPSITLAILTIDDFDTFLKHDLNDVTIKALFPTYVARIIVMTIATMTLGIVGWNLHQSRNRLSRILSRYGDRVAEQRTEISAQRIL